MSENDQPHREAPLNPGLISRTETTYDLSKTPPPVETTSAREGEGEGWPIAWLVLVIVGVVLAIYFIL